MSAAGPIRAAEKTRDDWETPPELFDLLDREFPFSLDGAASGENMKCEIWLGPGSPIREENAFGWDGYISIGGEMVKRSIFCNPPYGRAENPCRPDCTKKTCPKRGYHLTEYRPGVDDWIILFEKWAGFGHTVVIVVPNATEVGWFKRAHDSAHEIRLLFGRVEFIGGETGNTGGTAVIIWRGFDPRPAGGAHIWLWDWQNEINR